MLAFSMDQRAELKLYGPTFLWHGCFYLATGTGLTTLTSRTVKPKSRRDLLCTSPGSAVEIRSSISHPFRNERTSDRIQALYLVKLVSTVMFGSEDIFRIRLTVQNDPSPSFGPLSQPLSTQRTIRSVTNATIQDVLVAHQQLTLTKVCKMTLSFKYHMCYDNSDEVHVQWAVCCTKTTTLYRNLSMCLNRASRNFVVLRCGEP